MPELPEVEVSRQGIAPHITGHAIEQMAIRNGSLRWPVDMQLSETLKGATVTRTARRGKYLLLHCMTAKGSTGVVLIHLGMSGSLRIVMNDAPIQKHDHIDWQFAHATLRYHDPRRFGSVLWHDDSDGDYLQHPRLINLGIEPFDAAFTTEHLFKQSRNKKTAIKVALLSGEMVVGVGNIYASEVLFRCKIHPEKITSSLTRVQCALLVKHIKTVLQEAISKGGSTLKDFVNSNGASGYFQMHYNVYDRAGKPCTTCTHPISRIIQTQRATYFCPFCQKKPRVKS